MAEARGLPCCARPARSSSATSPTASCASCSSRAAGGPLAARAAPLSRPAARRRGRLGLGARAARDADHVVRHALLRILPAAGEAPDPARDRRPRPRRRGLARLPPVPRPAPGAAPDRHGRDADDRAAAAPARGRSACCGSIRRPSSPGSSRSTPAGWPSCSRAPASRRRPRLCAALMALTAGNPFLVTSLLAHFRADPTLLDRLQEPGGEADVPPEVTRDLALRLARLPAEAGALGPHRGGTGRRRLGRHSRRASWTSGRRSRSTRWRRWPPPTCCARAA